MFNKKLKEVSRELEELKKEVNNLKDEVKKSNKNIMKVSIVKLQKKEKMDELGRVYDVLDGGVYYYDADRRYVDCHRDCTGRQFVDIIDMVTREIILGRELHEDEYFTVTKES